MNVSVERPTISVITACYNSGRFLERIYSSLAAQTYRQFEWVCVDDCSTDGTVERLLSLPVPGAIGMQIFRLPINTGGGSALGVAAERARCDVVLVLDHDDELLPSALETIGAAWAAAAKDPCVSGIMFRASNPITGEVIGGDLPEGKRINTSWLHNMHPDVTDATMAFKRELMLKYVTAETMESVTLWSTVLNRLTRSHPLIVGPPAPIRLYHRDNPNSQTASIRVSRKMVATYAALLDEYDRSYLRAIWRWIRHAVTLLRLSKDVHASMWTAIKLVRHRWLRGLMVLLMPIAAIVRARKPKSQLVQYPLFTTEMAVSLTDLRSESVGVPDRSIPGSENRPASAASHHISRTLRTFP